MERYGNWHMPWESRDFSSAPSLLVLAISAAAAPIVIVNGDNRVVWTNCAFTDLYGLAQNAILEIDYAQLETAAGYAFASNSPLRCEGFPNGGRRTRLTGSRADGSRFSADAHVSRLTSEGAPTHFVAVIYDATQSSTAQAAEKRRAVQEELTGLACRSHVLELLQSALAAPPDVRQLLAVLFIDLDGFKGINDSFGHHVGDCLLKAVAARLVGVVRFTNTVARFGGDEFLILLPTVDGRSAAKQIGAHIVQQLGQPFAIGKGLHHISASVGIAFCPDHGQTAESLVICADEAMYRAKGRGGNQLAVAARRTDLVQPTGFQPIQSRNASFKTINTRRHQRPPSTIRNV